MLVLWSVPSHAQTETVPAAPAPVIPLTPPIQPAATPFFGIQLPLPPPGAPLSPPVAPTPSQTHLPTPLPAPGSAPSGPLFDFHPTLFFSEQFSDNFLISPTNKVQNFRSLLTPGVLVGLNGSKTLGTASANLGVAEDTSSGGLSFFPNASVAVRHEITPRLSVSLVDQFMRSDEPALSNQFGLQQQRQTFNSNTFGLAADWQVDLLRMLGYYQLVTFFGSTESISNIAGANVAIPIGALTTVKVGYEFSHSSIPDSSPDETTGNLVWASLARQVFPLTTLGAWTSYSIQSLDSSRIFNGSLFGAYELPGQLALSASLGYGLLTADTRSNLGTVTTNTTLSYRFAKAVIAVGFLQDFNQTYLQGQNFGVTLTRSLTGSVSYAVTPFIDAMLGASYNDNTFTGVGNAQTTPNSKTISATAGVSWRIVRWLTAGLNYTYTRYNAGATSSTGSNVNQVTLSLATSF